MFIIGTSQKKIMKISRLLFLGATIIILEGCGAVNASSSRQEISFKYVQKQAELLSKKSYTKPVRIKNDLTNSEYNQITFNSSKSLWMSEALPFRLELFHLGYIYDTPIVINEFKGLYSQDIRFTNDLFNFGLLAQEIMDKAKELKGYAGIKVLCQLNKPGQFDELISFLGTEKFRALGRCNIYGPYAIPLITRATDNKINKAHYTEFWVGKPNPKANSLTIYAVADSPDAAFAFQYEIYPGDDTNIKVKSTIYPRTDALSVGIAPMSTLYFFGVNTHSNYNFCYSQFHYSDGLIMNSENNIFYKPLENYNQSVISELKVTNVKFFGLIQRDRNYDHYQTPFMALHLMPNLWITPDNPWQNGKVILAETPTNNTNALNVHVFWVPEEKLYRGKSYSYNYTMHWATNKPDTGVGYVTSTKVGADGNNICFSVKFTSDLLKQLPAVTNITANTTVSANSKIISTKIQKDPFDHQWISLLTISKPVKNKQVPISLSCTLMNENKPITETWTYKWIPEK